MVPRRLPPSLAAVLLFGAVFAVIFAPVLSGRATLVHGDALSVSLPLQQVLATSLAEGSLPLWSPDIYGGHPIFAEGQGGFAHPVNLVLFGLLPRLDAADAWVGTGTLYAHGLLHVLCGLIAAVGMFALCRSLGLGATASAFAALALACSQDWLGTSGNSAIALSSAFAPLALLAVDCWWRKPDVTRALYMGLAVTAMLLAGYPQAVHGFAILALALLVVRADLSFWRAPWRHLVTGLLAVGVAIGLSAIQLLPTFELAAESVRAEGVELVQSGTPSLQLRGMLFSIGRRAVVEPGLGSILVLGLVGVGLRFTRPVFGWLLGSLVLFQLSLADLSPLYRALHHVLPGLDSFRITHLYATIGLIGVSVLAGFGVQRLADMSRSEVDRGFLAQAAVTVLVLAGLGWASHHEEVRLASYATFLLAIGVVTVLLVRRAPGLTGVALVGVLLLEIALLRLPLHDFVDVRTVLEPPPTVQRLLQRHPNERDFQVAHVPHFFSYIGFASGSAPGLPRLADLFLASLDGGSNLIWGIPSVDANLALPLSRRVAVEELIVADVRGESERPPGDRFIDAIGVRYVLAHNKHRKRPYSEDLREIFYDEDLRFLIRENRNARRRLQIIPARDVHWVPDVAGAVAAFRGGPDGRLVLEGDAAASGSSAPDAVGADAASVVAAESRAESHVVVVEAREPVYVVLADAPYPGWKARLDGEETPIIGANVLAKAVLVPKGTHRVELSFEPASYAWGRRISLGCAVGVGVLWVVLARTRRERSQP